MKSLRRAIPVLLIIAIAGIAGAAIYILGPFSSDNDTTSEPNSNMFRYRSGDVEVGVMIDPRTARVGENRLIVELRDADGEPVQEVEMEAFAEMPAMGAMPAMRAPADMHETGAGRYEGAMDLSMRGEWPLTIGFETPQGDPVRMQFDLATDRSELPIASGGTPVNAETGIDSPDDDDGLPRFRAGDIEIAIGTDPHIPHVGDNQIVIEVRDGEGRPVDDIEIEAFAQMPAMGAMPAMRAPADLTRTGPGRFEGSMDLSMRGEWPLTVEFSHPQYGERRLQFDFATDREGLTIAAGGVPVGSGTTAAGDANAISIDNRRRQLIGVETGQATQRDLVKRIRAVGEVAFDERLMSQVTLKFDGYIGDLKADFVGADVARDQVLFTVYSPELLAAQREYLETRKRRANTDDGLLRAARQRLALWDMTDEEITALEERSEPQTYVAIHSPRRGTLIERSIADGSAAKAGQPLLTIADLSRVWIEAEVFEADLELVHVGMSATVTLPYLPGRTYPATVEYIYPYLQGETRTGRIRLSLENPNGELKPDMYAEVMLEAEIGRKLSVPEEAVIVAGESRVVFVDLGGGRLNPVRIKTGRMAGGFVEVLDGLSPGDTVVTSGNFLIAAETRLKTGVDQW